MTALAIQKSASLSGDRVEAELKSLAARFPDKSLRRVPRLAKMALCAALEAAGGLPAPEALVIGTAYASVTSTFEFMDSIINDGAALASPTAFSHSVTNMCAAYLTQYLAISGPALTVTQPSPSAALEMARALLASGQAKNVLLGIVSEHSAIMEEIEKIAGCEETAASQGAVFYLLTLPDPTLSEKLIHFKRGGGEAG